jgi:hypothetical protein
MVVKVELVKPTRSNWFQIIRKLLARGQKSGLIYCQILQDPRSQSRFHFLPPNSLPANTKDYASAHLYYPLLSDALASPKVHEHPLSVLDNIQDTDIHSEI